MLMIKYACLNSLIKCLDSPQERRRIIERDNAFGPDERYCRLRCHLVVSD